MTKEEVAKVRRWFGLTLIEMGRKIGAHYTVLCEIERGNRQPTEVQLRKLLVMRERMFREMKAAVGA